jgi:hypothetical protein
MVGFAQGRAKWISPKILTGSQYQSGFQGKTGTRFLFQYTQSTHIKGLFGYQTHQLIADNSYRNLIGFPQKITVLIVKKQELQELL